MALVLAVALLIVEADVSHRKSLPGQPKPAEPKLNLLDPSTLSLVQTLNPHAAGIDLSDDEHWVAVPEGSVPDRPQRQRDQLPSRVRRFGTCTADLRDLADWMRKAGVDTVAMEATGVYWIPLYDLLESEGFRVLLVDPHQVCNAPGRPKTDVKDCMWIQRLHSLGLLTAAFRPEEPIRVLRSYQRHRHSLIEDQSRFILRMQKALEQMNVKLTETIQDIMGVTGLAIIKAILAGERDPQKLAGLRQPGCKHPTAQFARALEGTWQQEHLFALKQSLELYEYFGKQLAECDRRIEEQIKTLARPEKPGPLPPPSKPRRSRRQNDLHFEARRLLYEMAAVDLTAIEGIDVNTAFVVLSEIGTDMSHWHSERAFGAWLGLAPNPRKTGGKLKSARTRPGVNRAAQALRVAAQTLHKSKSALGAFFRRIAARRGVPKATTATAYKLARIIYAMLKHGQEYVKKAMDEYEAEYRERLVRNLKKKAAELGFELKEKEQQGQATSQG
jgi:transposase